MSNHSLPQTKADQAAQYVYGGFVLVPITPNSKAPKGIGWNQLENAFTDPARARSFFEQNPQHNMGLLHFASNTAALDIDNRELAQTALQAVGIDLNQLEQENPYKIKGKNGEKPLYRIPEGLLLQAVKLTLPAINGEKPITVFELRGGAVQDVLPPSIHPDTLKPYMWGGGGCPDHVADLLELPEALLEVWQNWNKYKAVMLAALGVVKPTPTVPAKTAPSSVPRTQQATDQPTPIEAYNARYTVHDLLERNEYKRDGAKYIAPSSSTGMAGVTILRGGDGRDYAYSHHGSDLIADGYRHDAFDLYKNLEHGGDNTAAVKAAALEMGLDSKKTSFLGNTPNNPLPLTAINQTADQSKEETNSDWYVDTSLITARGWGPITPLGDLDGLPPELDPDLIPVPLKDFITDLSELSGLPREAFLAPSLCAIGSLIGRKVAVRPKRFDTSWIVTANLWGMVIGRPSSKKTFAISEGTKFLDVLEQKKRQEFEEDTASREVEVEMLEMKIKAKKSELEAALSPKTSKKNTAPTGFVADTEALKLELIELKGEAEVLKQASTPSRHVVNSTTVEKLGELLRENPVGLLLRRDEINGFFGEMNKSGREGEKQFYLEAWNGTGQFTFDRIGRGTVHIPNMCVGVVGGIQPAIIQRHIQDAMQDGGGSDGFLQRFQMAVHIRRSSKGVDRSPNKEARKRVYALCEALDKLTAGTLGLQTEEGEIPALGFSPDAQKLFDLWRDEMDTRLIGDELKNFPMLESHLGKYGSLIPALALIYHLVDVVDHQTVVGEISLEATRLACELGEFLEAHARITYAAEINSVPLGAYTLARWIADGKIKDGMRLRKLERGQWSGLPPYLEASFSLLEKHGIAAVVKVLTTGAKRPTRVIALNPDLDLELLKSMVSKGDEEDG